jgi:PhzF family phenazine biosynthesis protein
MKLKVYQVDTFTSRVLAGNPAVVVCLDEWLPDHVLQAIAVEHNISTTAFLVERGAAFEIRYFLPVGEVPLVGHASLAAGYLVLDHFRPEARAVEFQRRHGRLDVERLDAGLTGIRLPAMTAEPCTAPAGLAAALGIASAEVRATAGQYFVFLADQAAVASLDPDMDALLRLDRDGVVVTARGRDCDFVSRAFAPKEGLPEDPVCGSAHLALVPYWSDRLGRHAHRALQLSPRGGELHCVLEGDTVRLAGRCALYLQGTITI